MDFEYKCSTFSRAQGVRRRNFKEDFIDGLLLKQLIFISEVSNKENKTEIGLHYLQITKLNNSVRLTSRGIQKMKKKMILICNLTVLKIEYP